MSAILDGPRGRAWSLFLCFLVFSFVIFQSACGGSTHNNSGTSSGSGSGGTAGPGSGSGSGSGGSSGGSGNGGNNGGSSGSNGGSSGSGGSGGPTTAAYVYVGSNPFNGNGPLSGFVVGSDGTAQPVPGSPSNGASGFVVGTSSYLFATDSKNIVTYTRASDGSVQATASIDGTARNQTPEGSAISSLSVDRTGQTVYANELNYDGTSNNAYSYFGIGSGGALTFLNSSGIDSNYNSPLVFTQDDQYAYGQGCYHFTWEVYGFSRTSDGTLTSFNPNAALPPNQNPNAMNCPIDSAASAGNYLVVAYYDLSNQSGNYFLASYAINADGTLGLVQNSEVTTPFTGETSIAFDPSGTYLAMAGQNGLQVYSIDANGMLTPVGTVQLPSVAFVQLRWDNSNHLYAITDSGLYIFSSSNGALTEIGSPYPVSEAGSLAVLPAS